MDWFFQMKKSDNFSVNDYCFKRGGMLLLFVFTAFVLMVIRPELMGRQKAHPLDWAMIVARHLMIAYEGYVEERQSDPNDFNELVPFLPDLPTGIDYDTYPIVFFNPIESGDLLFAIPMDVGLVVGRRFGSVEFMPSTHNGRIFPAEESKYDRLLVALIVSLLLNALLILRFACSRGRVSSKHG